MKQFFKKIRLTFYIFEEIFFSFFLKTYNKFYKKWSWIPENEFNFLSNNFNLDQIDKIVVIGSGAIPNTALYFAQKKDNIIIYAVERNYLAFFSSIILLHRLKIKNVKIIRNINYLYDYDNGLIIITLHTVLKQTILNKILNRNNKNVIIVIRQPLNRFDHFERVFIDEIGCFKIRQSDIFESIVIFVQ